MTQFNNGSNWMQRLWASVIEASATAVAIHYATPWNRALDDHAG